MLAPLTASRRPPGVTPRVTSLLLLLTGAGALGLAYGPPAAAQAPSSTEVQRRAVEWVVARGVAPAGAIDVAFDARSRSAVVAWAASDGVWMRRVALDDGTLEAPRRLMEGRGFAAPRLELLPAGDGNPHDDLLLVVERGGAVLARGFRGDGAPLGAPILLSRGLPGVHSGVATLATGEGVVVAWAHIHRGQRILFTRVDRDGSPRIARRVVHAPALQPLLAERPPAAGPGFLLDTLDADGHTLRAFDLDGEQVAMARFHEPFRIAFLPHDDESVLALSVHHFARGRRVAARRLDDEGAVLEPLGAIGPGLDVLTRLEDRALSAAADRESGVAVTYGRQREPDELLSLELFVFEPDLSPRRGRGHRLAEGRVADVSAPVWTDAGEVLVAWHDASRGRLVLRLVPPQA